MQIIPFSQHPKLQRFTERYPHRQPKLVLDRKLDRWFFTGFIPDKLAMQDGIPRLFVDQDDAILEAMQFGIMPVPTHTEGNR